MARHEIVIHENTSTATRESAPYLGSYIAKETVALAEFAAASPRRSPASVGFRPFRRWRS